MEGNSFINTLVVGKTEISEVELLCQINVKCSKAPFYYLTVYW